jgi:hypothetical protein
MESATFDPFVGGDPLAPAEPVIDPQFEELFKFETAKTRIKNLIENRSGQIADAKGRRKERYVELDVEALQEDGTIQEDETFIPVRVIDGNISSDMPTSMAFLNANHRLAIFHPTNNPDIKPRNVESEFTRVCTYQNWSRDFTRTFDGSRLHGWDALEVVFDISKPGHVAFEHVGYDKLFFNTAASELQDSEMVLREYDVTLMRLWAFIADNGFNGEEVYKVCPKDDKNKRDKTVRIYKYYCKYQGIVHVGWLSLEGACTDWLKNPEPLRLGIHSYEQSVDPMTGQPFEQWVDKDIDQYPIFLRVNKDDEQEHLDEKKGIGFLDGPQQEATTALITSFVNGTMRASNIFAAPDVDDPDTSEMKQLDLQLVPGGIYNKPLKFWAPPYPEVSLLSGLQYLGTLNATHNGKLATAVSNRKDARKTAEELGQAKEAEQKQAATNQLADSEFLRGVFSFAWLVIQSQAMQDKIEFLKKKVEGDPMMAQIGPIYQNDYEIIGESYDIRPAGDVDIIEAEAEVQKMMVDWPVVQTFPGLSAVFIQEYIRLRYPKKADDYLAAMNQGDPAPGLVAALSTLAQAFASPQELAALPPEEQQKVMQIAQQAQAYLASKQEQPK